MINIWKEEKGMGGTVLSLKKMHSSLVTIYKMNINYDVVYSIQKQITCTDSGTRSILVFYFHF